MQWFLVEPLTSTTGITGYLVRNAHSAPRPTESETLRGSVPQVTDAPKFEKYSCTEVTITPPASVTPEPAGGSKGQLEELQALETPVLSVPEPACLTTLFNSFLTAGSASSNEFEGHGTSQL